MTKYRISLIYAPSLTQAPPHFESRKYITEIHKIYYFSFKAFKFDLQFICDTLMLRKNNSIVVFKYYLPYISFKNTAQIYFLIS